MTRHYYQLPRLAFDRTWTLGPGPARFLPNNAVMDIVASALAARPRSRSHEQAMRLARERLADWSGDALLEVVAATAEDAATIAEESLAVLRFFVRRRVAANPESHRIGLVGEMPAAIRHTVVLWDDQEIIATGWQRIGGTVAMRFGTATLDDWDADERVRLLGRQLALPTAVRSVAGRRAVTALMALDEGFRSLEPSLRILCAAIAVEVLFSREDAGEAPQSMAIARRIAYLNCGAGCGRIAAHCPYTQQGHSHKTLLAALHPFALRGVGWQCSTFLEIAGPSDVLPALRHVPLFTARNNIAHRGAADLGDTEIAHLIQSAEEAVMTGLTWYARHPNDDMSLLDAEIDGQVPT